MHIRDFFRQRPRIYDATILLKRMIGVRPPAFRFFDRFSREHGDTVRFVQIGANDGLRKDPIREFVVRRDWRGILVEPLPAVFGLLKRNYERVEEGRLVYVNAAVSCRTGEELSFWTFTDGFLAALGLEKRLSYLRKSSFRKEHLRKFVPAGVPFEEAVHETRVPCISLCDLVDRHWKGFRPDLLVVDAEGHEAEILGSVDFSRFSPEAIFFETTHLGPKEGEVMARLAREGYEIERIGEDAVARCGAGRRPAPIPPAGSAP